MGETKETMSKLKEIRKEQAMPHISYDIDGDGFVSTNDYFFAKKFDSNNDGILEDDER